MRESTETGIDGMSPGERRAEVVDLRNAAVPELVLPDASTGCRPTRATATFASRPTASSIQLLSPRPMPCASTRSREARRERVLPQLERDPRRDEAERDERRQDGSVAARQPEERRAEPDRDRDDHDGDDVATLAHASPTYHHGWKTERVGLRVDVQQMRRTESRPAARPRRRPPRRPRAAGFGWPRSIHASSAIEEERRDVEEVPLLDPVRVARREDARPRARATRRARPSAAANTRRRRSRCRAFATSTISAAKGRIQSERSSSARWRISHFSDVQK